MLGGDRSPMKRPTTVRLRPPEESIFFNNVMRPGYPCTTRPCSTGHCPCQWLRSLFGDGGRVSLDSAANVHITQLKAQKRIKTTKGIIQQGRVKIFRAEVGRNTHRGTSVNGSTGKRGRTRTAGPPPDERLGRNRVELGAATNLGLAIHGNEI